MICARGVFLTSSRLWAADLCSSRVLGFDNLGAQNNPLASVLVGAPTWTNDMPSGVVSPNGLRERAGYLWVADSTRVLAYPLPVTGVGIADPAFAVGQPNTTDTMLPLGPSQDRLFGAEDVDIDEVGGRLFVSDSGNNRVLVWNALPSTSGVPADIVLGQPDFFSDLPNLGGTPTAGSLSRPEGLLYLDGHLFVSDGNNNRVLVWTDASLVNGGPADYVLGQPDFTSGADRGVAPQTIGFPFGLCTDGAHLWVTQGTLHRVTRFTLYPPP